MTARLPLTDPELDRLLFSRTWPCVSDRESGGLARHDGRWWWDDQHWAVGVLEDVVRHAAEEGGDAGQSSGSHDDEVDV